MKLLFHLLTSLTSAELSDQPKTLGKKGKVSLCKTYIPVTRKTGENVTGERSSVSSGERILEWTQKAVER